MEKGNQFTAILYGLVAILNINEKVLFLFFVVMAFDMMFGAIKSVSVPELSFSMKVFFFGALRKLTLVAIVLFVATLAKGLGYDDTQDITTTSLKTLMITEGISVFYCFRSIWTRKEAKPQDYITVLIDSAIRGLGKIIEKIANSMNNSSCL